MRGAQLFDNLELFPEDGNSEVAVKKKGRNEDLVRLRNERLCARLYWLKKTKSKIDYKYILEQLSEEFDLTLSTIPQITEMDECQRELRRLQNEAPDAKYFRNKWPWIVW